MAWALATAKTEMLRWVGTREDPPGSNNHHFSRWYGLRDKWCQMSVNYILVKGGLPPPGGGRKGSAFTAGCAQWYDRRGKFSAKTFRPGCSVYFNFGDPNWGNRWRGIHHVGIGLAEKGNQVLVWQGNSGDRVRVRWEFKSDIAGYGYNDWGTATGPGGGAELELGMGLYPGQVPRGAKDAHVRQVQHRLNQIGKNRHSSIGNRALAEDGEFGDQTRKVLVDFQRHRPWLHADGRIGIDDWSALRFAIAPAAASYPGHVHRQGEDDVHVKLIQIRLNDIANGHHGALGGKALPVDGKFSGSLQQVVADFQLHRGLPSDGVVDQRAWARLWTRR
jgi:peptidoglycan hydrolase-like protein with peptidoglycan-binding domain